jgi:hypothetical protein
MSVHDFTVKYDGRGYIFEVFVNSNEPPEEIAWRLTKAARGQIKAACFVRYNSLTPDEVKERMAMLAELAVAGVGTEINLSEDKKETP